MVAESNLIEPKFYNSSGQTFDLTWNSVFKLVRGHPFWLVFCLLACLLLNTWFYYHPPRGMESTNIIYLGTVWGNPLVEFSKFWGRFYYDDKFISKIIIDSGIANSTKSEEILKLLNSSIRTNLSYSIEEGNLVKITFRQPTSRNVRPFLNLFTERILEKLQNLGREELEFRVSRVEAILGQVNQRLLLVQTCFDLASGTSTMISSGKSPFHRNSIQTGPSLTSNLPNEMVSQPKSFIKTLGEIIRNEIEIQKFQTTFELGTLILPDFSALSLYPREPLLLTDPLTPPKPVQSFFEVIFLLVPVGTLLIAFAGLLFFEKNK